MATFLFVAVAQCYAQDSQTAYNFLRIPVSAHAKALGGENITVIEDDAALIFSNPALAASVSDKTIGLAYSHLSGGINMGSANFTKVFKEKATLAAGAQFINYGKMREVDENNVQTGEFSPTEVAVSATFAYQLARNLVGGITAKAVMAYIGKNNSMGFGVDLGLNYYHPDREWSISAVARNLGGQLKAFEEDYDPMPFDLQLGVSKTFKGLPVRLSATFVDLTHYNYPFIQHLCLGADVLLSSQIWIGAGYNFRSNKEMNIVTNDGESSHAAGLTLGAGINLERFKLNLSYAKQHVSAHSLNVNVAFTL